MQPFQKEFIEFAIELKVLRFGEFTLKSGRVSPYFFNSGLFNSGTTLARLGSFYAAAIQHSGLAFEGIYGPAYKGIPLATATSMAFASDWKRDLPYSFNRKEAKDHGEGGIIVGAPLQGKTLIIDDVITAGTSVRESLEIIDNAGAEAVGVAIALDRQERGTGSTSAIQEIEEQHHLAVIHIITFADIIEYIQDQPDLATHLDAVNRYRDEYGC